MNLKEAAVAYARRGWSVFPLMPGSKRPLPGSRGFKDASCDPHTVAHIWDQAGANCNIGFVPATSRLMCLDIDPGADQAYVARLPPTMEVATPHGYHLYYVCDQQFGNGRLRPHIDIRSAHGYTVLPPSVVDGVEYKWVNTIDPIQLPNHVVIDLKAKRYNEQVEAPAEGREDAETIYLARQWLEHQKPDQDGYTIACGLVRNFGLSERAAVGRFIEWSDLQVWPWAYEDIVEKVKNARKYGQAPIGQNAPSDASEYPVDEIREDEAPDPAKNTAAWWIGREIVPSRQLIGPLSTTSRMMLVAATGVGKTQMGMAVACAVASSKSLCHWQVPEAKRVLYFDGEMPKSLMQERLVDAIRRVGGLAKVDDRLVLVSTADYPNWAPLNEQRGQEWADKAIEVYRPDLVIFDNVQSLTIGDMKETTSWAPVNPWMRELTEQGLAQIWVHHANKDGSSYGDKTREYQFNTVLGLLPCGEPEDGVHFELRYSKTRERHPGKNDADYVTGEFRIENDQWVFEPFRDLMVERMRTALEGEHGEGITTIQLVDRLIAHGDNRSKMAIRQWLVRNKNKELVGRFLAPGANPEKLMWKWAAI